MLPSFQVPKKVLFQLRPCYHWPVAIEYLVVSDFIPRSTVHRRKHDLDALTSVLRSLGPKLLDMTITIYVDYIKS